LISNEFEQNIIDYFRIPSKESLGNRLRNGESDINILMGELNYKIKIILMIMMRV
jgi:hypothetical protein